jgi:histone H3/H4
MTSVEESTPTLDIETTKVTDDDIDNDNEVNDNYEIFNKNTVKRMAQLAGIMRMSNSVVKEVNAISLDWIDNVLSKALTYLSYAKHKTFNVRDFSFLSSLYANTMTPFLAPDRVVVRPCKKEADLDNVLKGKLQGVVFTAKRTFDTFIHKRFSYIQEQNGGATPHYRLGTNEKNNNTVGVIQLMVEEYVGQVLFRARNYMENRDTLMDTDVRQAAV